MRYGKGSKIFSQSLLLSGVFVWWLWWKYPSVSTFFLFSFRPLDRNDLVSLPSALKAGSRGRMDDLCSKRCGTRCVTCRLSGCVENSDGNLWTWSHFWPQPLCAQSFFEQKLTIWRCSWFYWSVWPWLFMSFGRPMMANLHQPLPAEDVDVDFPTRGALGIPVESCWSCALWGQKCWWDIALPHWTAWRKRWLYHTDMIGSIQPLNSCSSPAEKEFPVPVANCHVWIPSSKTYQISLRGHRGQATRLFGVAFLGTNDQSFIHTAMTVCPWEFWKMSLSIHLGQRNNFFFQTQNVGRSDGAPLAYLEILERNMWCFTIAWSRGNPQGVFCVAAACSAKFCCEAV